MVEALVGSQLGAAVRTRMRGCELHGPDTSMQRCCPRLGIYIGRASSRPAQSRVPSVSSSPPRSRDIPLADLLAGAWRARDRLRLVDALYVELSEKIRAGLLTTDARLARATPMVELVTA